MGHLKEIVIKVKVCAKCRRAVYPEFYQNGLLFIHNKFLITLESILDLSHVLQTGGSFISAVKKKFLLLGQLEGLDKEDIEKDLTNKIVCCVVNTVFPHLNFLNMIMQLHFLST